MSHDVSSRVSDDGPRPRPVRGVSDLEQGDLSEKIARLRIFFLHEFEYARYLSIHPANRFSPYRHSGNAISRFLLEGRRGHCEYFASATTLLLREAGVPARYSVLQRQWQRPSHSCVVLRRRRECSS